MLFNSVLICDLKINTNPILSLIHISVVEDAIRQAVEVQEYIDSWEPDDEDDELDEKRLWRRVLSVTGKFTYDSRSVSYTHLFSVQDDGSRRYQSDGCHCRIYGDGQRG